MLNMLLPVSTLLYVDTGERGLSGPEGRKGQKGDRGQSPH